MALSYLLCPWLLCFTRNSPDGFGPHLDFGPEPRILAEKWPGTAAHKMIRPRICTCAMDGF